MAQQYLRACSVVASDDAGNGIELNELSIRFVVHHGTYTFPHTADIEIINLSRETQDRFKQEFTKIRLLAGYEGNFGVIFQGAIKQVTVGHRSATEGFLNIFAADGDRLHNFGYVNRTLQAGYTQEQVWSTITDAAAPYNKTAPLTTAPKQSSGPRGKVMYGPVHDYIQDFSETNQQLVTVDNGILTALPLLAFKPGDTVIINANTGMIGSPEQTEAGITVTCLLNPAIMWATRIQLNNDDITQKLVSNAEAISRAGTGVRTSSGDIPIYAPLGTDGMYKALSVDHIGETRGNAWYTQIICISLDPTAQVTPATTALGLGNQLTPSTPLP